MGLMSRIKPGRPRPGSRVHRGARLLTGIVAIATAAASLAMAAATAAAQTSYAVTIL